MAWTEAGSGDGFLTLDLNGDGEVDHGGELFGDATTAPTGQVARHGFIALWRYDQAIHGGNEDGHIGMEDQVYSRLRLWVDGNHDGRSQEGEFFGLEEVGVGEIDLRYIQANSRDRYGNLIKYQGFTSPGGLSDTSRRMIRVVDVYLVRD